MLNKILGYSYEIVKIVDNRYIMFFGSPLSHEIISNALAEKLYVYDNNGQIKWNRLLRKLGFAYFSENDGNVFSPIFISESELKRFVMIVNNNFLIQIR